MRLPRLAPSVSFRAPLLFLLLCKRTAAVYDGKNKLEMARLYGDLDGFGYYFVDLIIGTPPQRVSVILDTGSGLCGFPCKNCDHCGRHIDAPFDFEKSQSAQWVKCGSQCAGGRCDRGKCTYRRAYLEGSSIDGMMFEDMVSLGDAIQSNPPVKAQMGCHKHENKLFYTQQANGIFGIQGPQSLLQKFFRDHEHVNKGIFAICLSSNGGRLTVGGSKSSDHLGEVQEVKYHGHRFEVPLSSLHVSGKKVSGFRITLVDSGTTFTYLPSSQYKAFRAGIEDYCRAHHNCGSSSPRLTTCYSVKDLSQFPSIEVYFSGASQPIAWHPEEYMYYRRRSKVWCFAFENDGPATTTTLGASFMLNKDIIFDTQRMKMGIVAANCPQHRAEDRPRHHEGQTWEMLAAARSDPSILEAAAPTFVTNVTRIIQAEGADHAPGDAKINDSHATINTSTWSEHALEPMPGTLGMPSISTIVLTVAIVLGLAVCLQLVYTRVMGKKVAHTALPSEEHEDFRANPNVVGIPTVANDDDDDLKF